MSFRCGGSDGLTSALSKSSAVEYFVSQLPDGNIGKNSIERNAALQISCAMVLTLHSQSVGSVVSANYTC